MRAKSVAVMMPRVASFRRRCREGTSHVAKNVSLLPATTSPSASASARARVQVDVRVDAALADQPKLRQALEQRRADLGALADQHEGLTVAEPLGEHVDVQDVVVPDRDVVVRELVEAVERSERVEP